MATQHIEVVSPVAAFQDVAGNVVRHAARSGWSGKRALLLPAEKSSSLPFIDALVKRMAAETDAKHVFTANPEWPFFHPARAAAIVAEADALARRCDLMVSGVAY
jgi:hypothetical protein